MSKRYCQHDDAFNDTDINKKGVDSIQYKRDVDTVMSSSRCTLHVLCKQYDHKGIEFVHNINTIQTI